MAEFQDDSLTSANLDGDYSDNSIYPALMAGDQDAWNRFYLHYKDLLRSYFRKKLITNEADQEDLLQQTLTQVFKSLPSYDPDRVPLRHWIYGIAANMLRRHKKQYIEEKEAIVQSVDLENIASLNDNEPSKASVPTSTKNALDNALAQLSDVEQALIRLRLERGDEWTWASIAQELGMKESAAKMRHKRALVKLRDILSGK